MYTSHVLFNLNPVAAGRERVTGVIRPDSNLQETAFNVSKIDEPKSY